MQLLCRHTRKITQKYRKYKYRSLHKFKGEGWRVRRIVKHLKGEGKIYKTMKKLRERLYEVKKLSE